AVCLPANRCQNGKSIQYVAEFDWDANPLNDFPAESAATNRHRPTTRAATMPCARRGHGRGSMRPRPRRDSAVSHGHRRADRGSAPEPARLAQSGGSRCTVGGCRAPRRAIAGQRFAQPLIRRLDRTSVALDRIRFAAHAAFGRSQLDKILGGPNAISRRQVVVLLPQVRLRLSGIVPGAISIEAAPGLLDISEQIIDFDPSSRRWCRMHDWKIAQCDGEGPRQRGFHSSRPSGNSDNSLTLNLCQPLRAGSRTYSTL